MLTLPSQVTYLTLSKNRWPQPPADLLLVTHAHLALPGYCAGSWQAYCWWWWWWWQGGQGGHHATHQDCWEEQKQSLPGRGVTLARAPAAEVARGAARTARRCAEVPAAAAVAVPLLQHGGRLGGGGGGGRGWAAAVLDVRWAGERAAEQGCERGWGSGAQWVRTK
eukprot:1158322-Pelagomonas_calceolata.AAC.8